MLSLLLVRFTFVACTQKGVFESCYGVIYINDTFWFFGRFLSQASHTHDAITEAAQLMKEAVDDIMVTLNEAASEVGMVGGMVDSIAEAMSKVSTEIQSPFHFALGSRCALQGVGAAAVGSPQQWPPTEGQENHDNRKNVAGNLKIL